MITTNVYRLPPSLFANTLTRRWISRNWWIPAIPVLLCLILGITVNIAFVYISLMIIFLVFPTVLMLIYFNLALSEAGRKHMLPCQASILQSADVHLKFYSYSYSEDDLETQQFMQEELINRRSIASFNVSGKHIIIFVKQLHSPIFIPIDAFLSKEDAEKAIKRLENASI